MKPRGPRTTAGASAHAVQRERLCAWIPVMALLLWPAMARADIPSAHLEATQDGCEVSLEASFSYHEEPPPCEFTIYRVDERTNAECIVFDGVDGYGTIRDCTCQPYIPNRLGDATDLVDTPCLGPDDPCGGSGRLSCACTRYCVAVVDQPGPGTFSYRVEGIFPFDHLMSPYAETTSMTFAPDCVSQGTCRVPDAGCETDCDAGTGPTESDGGCATVSGRDEAPWGVFLLLLLIGLAAWRRPGNRGGR